MKITLVKITANIWLKALMACVEIASYVRNNDSELGLGWEVDDPCTLYSDTVLDQYKYYKHPKSF